MLFSLIVPTLGRVNEVQKLLNSLVAQTFKDFEVIIVDQNNDDKLDKVVSLFSDRLKLRHLKTKVRGASRARNIGISEAIGDILTFPDDDCWYPNNLLNCIEQLLSEHDEWDGVSGMVMGPDRKESVGRWDSMEGYISKYNQWTRHSEITLFLRSTLFEDVKFDESLGVGAGTPWGSGESADLLLRILNKGYVIFYTPQIQIYHPLTVNSFHIEDYSMDILNRTYRYAMGMGHILKKHNYSYWFMIYQVIRPLGGVLVEILKLNKSKAFYHLTSFRGRIKGVLMTKNL